MGQEYTDYLKASRDAAHAGLQKMHAFEESLTPTQKEMLKGFVLTLTESNADRLNKPAAHSGEHPTIIVEMEETSGNLTAFTRIRKLAADVRPVRNENGELPFPFNSNSIIPRELATLLADLNEKAPGKEFMESFLCGETLELSPILGRELTKDEAKALSTGKLQQLTFDGFFLKKLNKRYGFMGRGFLVVNAWNDSYSANKWVLHVHDDGQIFAEYLDVTNHIKKNHL